MGVGGTNPCLFQSFHTHSRVQRSFYSMDTGKISIGVKWPKREAVHLPSSIAEVKNAWSCTSTVLFSCSIKHRENFTLKWLICSISQNSKETGRKKILAGHKRSNAAAIYASKLLLFPCLRWAIIWSPNGEGRTARHILWWNNSDKMWR